MKVIPLYGTTVDELRSAIQEGSLEKPSLGFIFSSVSLGIESLAEMLSSFSADIIGCSTSGEILPNGDSLISHFSAVGCLMDMDPALFSSRIFHRTREETYDLGASVGRWGKERFSDPVFMIFVSGLQNDSEQIVRGIADQVSGPVQVYGGVAGDDAHFQETFVLKNGDISSDGVVAVVFDGQKIQVEGLVASGWVGLGVEKTITRSTGNVVYTIDDLPATDTYKEYLKVSDDELQSFGFDFPLIVNRNDGSSVIRAPLKIEIGNKSLIFAGSVPEGSKVTFACSSGKETIDSSVKTIDAFAPSIRNASLLLLFSCFARHQAIGDQVKDEILAVLHHSNAPLVGFFTYGEIGNTEYGSCEFHNETLILVALSLKH